MSLTVTNPSYDRVYTMYAWRDNNVRLVLTQGEGATTLDGTAARIKAPRFQLRDDQGVMDLSGSPVISLALTRPDKSEDLLACTIIDATNGIISCPITASATAIAGQAVGEIRLSSTNGTIKFFGVHALIYDGVSNSAAAQSTQFSALVDALQKVATVDPDGSNTVALDSAIVENGTNPVASGVIYAALQVLDNAKIDKDKAVKYTGSNDLSECVDNGVLYRVHDGTTYQILLCNSGDAYRVQYMFKRSGEVVFRTSAKSNDTWGAWSTWSPIGTTSNIADGAVTTAKIADNAVTAQKISGSAVTTEKINNGAVTESKVGNGAITTDKIHDSAVNTNKIADSAVTAEKIAVGAVTENELADDAVETEKINNGAVTVDKIGNGAVSTDKIYDGAVTTPKINNGAVTSDKLGSSSVTTEKINDGAVTSAKIENGAVTSAKIGSGEVKTTNVDDGAVTTAKIKNGAVTTDKLGIGQVTPEKLSFTAVRYVGSNDIDECVESGVLYRVYYGSVYELLICGVGTYSRTQYLIKRDGGIQYRTAQKSNDEWGTWGSWYRFTTEDNVATMITSNTPKKMSVTVRTTDWSNNSYDITSLMPAGANENTKVDAMTSGAVQEQLIADGCGGIYVSTDTSNSTTTFTMHALYNTPTANITVQLILTQLVSV